MRFWPFGGGKRKGSNVVETQSREVAQEKQDELARQPVSGTERSGAWDPEKMSSANNSSRVQFNENSRKISKATGPASNKPSTPPSRNYPRSVPLGSSSRPRPPKTFIEHFSAHEPIYTSERGSVTDHGSSIYRQAAASRSSIGPENFNVTKTPPTLSRRSDQDASLPRHKSSKRKAEEHAREREVRAMSSPIPIPKRSTTRSEGVLRKESKKVPGDLNRRLERPRSEISLPLPESFSEMNDVTDQHSFKVNAFAVLSPRPTIKYNGSSRFASARESNRSRTSARQLIVEEDFSSKKRIDDLADDLDSGGLRELMEKDQRRRDKKRESDKAKLHRKLQRRADRQREDEQRRLCGTGGRPQTPIGKNVQRSGGLAIDTEMNSSPIAAESSGQAMTDEHMHSSSPIVPSAAQDFAVAEDPFADEGERDASTDEHLSQAAGNPFSHEDDNDPEPPLQSASNPFSHRDDNKPGISATTLMTTAIHETGDGHDTAQSPTPNIQHEVLPAAGMPSPPTSRMQSPVESATSPQDPTLPKDQPFGVRESVEPGRLDSGLASPPTSNWTTFFKMGGRRKRSSTDRGSIPPEFSNTSRESFARQQPPPVPPPRSFQRSGSGAPKRTRSKFREDLPELPISPPDSRVQSPETAPAHHATTDARSASFDPMQTAGQLADGKSLATSSSIPTLDRSGSRQDDRLSQQRSLDLHATDVAAAAAPALSQSLASVDSEGSWLSGKPVKRSSLPMGHPLRQSQSSLLAVGTSDDTEENDVADDEYFHRLTPAPEETRSSSHASAIRKASSTVINMGGDGEYSPEPELPALPGRNEETWHGSVGRQPTLVRQTSRAKSKEGLLNDFLAGEPDLSSPEDENASPELGHAGEEYQNSPILRARSIEYGKGHARHISAGSARLLDIRRSSVVPEVGSMPVSVPNTARNSTLLLSEETEKKA